MDDGGALGADQLSEAAPSDVLEAGGGRGVRPSGRVIGSVAAVLALLVGAVVTVTALSGETGQEPESLVPATSFAFAKVDLDPPSDQASALGAFAGRFPTAKSSNASELRANAVEALIRSSHLDYAKDVKPWLGRRVAVAGFPDAAGKSQVVFVLQTKEADAAKAALAKLPEPPAVEARGGFVVVAKDRTVLTAALAAADTTSLGEDQDFKADTAKLTGAQVVLGWMDNKATMDVMTADSPGDSSADPFIAALRKTAVGRSVVGIHAAKDYVEISGVTTGAPAMPVGSPSRMATLPDDSIGAAYLRDPSATWKSGITGFGLAGQFAFRLPGGSLFALGALGRSSASATASASASAAPCLKDPSPPTEEMIGWSCYTSSDSQATIGSAPPCPPDAACEVYGSATASAAASSAPSQPAPSPRALTRSLALDGQFDIFAAVQQLAAQLTGDTTLVLGSLPAPGGKRSPDAALIAEVAAGTSARDRADELARLLAQQFEEKTWVAVQDGVLTLASDKTYAQKLTGTLGKTDLFATAMGELGGNVQLAVFANLERVRDAVPGYPAEWHPVSAIGVSLARDGSDNVLRVRIVSR